MENLDFITLGLLIFVASLAAMLTRRIEGEGPAEEDKATRFTDGPYSSLSAMG